MQQGVRACSRPSCWCGWTCWFFFFSARLLWMGRNRKWVLEDSLQDAVWKTILRGPRPPSVRWEKPRNQSAAVTHQPGAKRNKSSSVKTEAKKKDPPQVAPPRRESITPDAAQAAARQRVGKLEAILSTLEDDDETAAVILVALTKARAQAQERPFPERVESARKFVERQQRAEQARASAAKAKEALAEAVALCFGRSSGLPGEGRIFVGRRGRDVVAAACCSATSFTLHRSTSASRPRHHRRGATYAACHRRIATRVDTIERFSCLSSGGCDSQGRRRDGFRWEFSDVGPDGGGALDGSPSCTAEPLCLVRHSTVSARSVSGRHPIQVLQAGVGGLRD